MGDWQPETAAGAQHACEAGDQQAGPFAHLDLDAKTLDFLDGVQRQFEVEGVTFTPKPAPKVE